MAEQETAVDLEVALAPYAERTRLRQLDKRMASLLEADSPADLGRRMGALMVEEIESVPSPGGEW